MARAERSKKKSSKRGKGPATPFCFLLQMPIPPVKETNAGIMSLPPTSRAALHQKENCTSLLVSNPTVGSKQSVVVIGLLNQIASISPNLYDVPRRETANLIF